MPNTRVLTGTTYQPDGSFWPAGGLHVIQLKRLSYVAGGTFPTAPITAINDVNGAWSAELWTNAEGLRPSRYSLTYPDGSSEEFVLPAGESAISIEALRALQGTERWTSTELAELFEVYMAELANTTNLQLGDALVGTRKNAVGAVGRTVHAKFEEIVTLGDFGAVGDVRSLSGLSITAASTALTASSTIFTAADVGKGIWIEGAGAPNSEATGALKHYTTIAAFVSATAVTLADAAVTAVALAAGGCGTDDTDAIQAALTHAATVGGVVLASAGFNYLQMGALAVGDISGIDLNGSTITQHNAIGNAPAIVVSGSNLTIENGTIVGVMSESGVAGTLAGDGIFNDSLYSSQFRRAIKITGSAVRCTSLRIDDAVVGIEYRAAGSGGALTTQPIGGEIAGCTFTNNVVYNDGWPGSNIACVAIYVIAAKGLHIHDNHITGWGEGIAGGQLNVGTTPEPVIEQCEQLTITGNIIDGCDDNCIYIGGIDVRISSNFLSGYNQSGVKSLCSPAVISGNIIKPEAGSGGIAVLPLKVHPVLSETTLNGAHLAGASTVTVASAADLSPGDWVGIHQQTKKPHYTPITSISGSVLTLARPLLDNAANGATVQELSLWNNEGVTVADNVISGAINLGISVYAFNDGMPIYLRSLTIHNNAVTFTGGVAKYGIYFAGTSRSEGAIVTGNHVRGHTRGLYMNTISSTLLTSTLVGDYESGATQVVVDAPSGFVVGDPIEIDLIDGTVHLTTITAIASSTFTLAVALPNAAEEGASLRRIGAVTYLTADLLALGTTLTVSDSSGFVTGNVITIALDAGGTHTATINGVPDSTTITIGTGPATQASSGNRITRGGAVATSVLLTANAALGAGTLTVQASQGWRAGDVIEVELDTGQRFSTVVQSTPTATTATILPVLPSAAASGNSATLAAASHKSATISENDFREATVYGIHLINAYKCHVARNHVLHCPTAGVQLDNARNCLVDSNIAGAVDTTKTQNIGFRMTGIADKCTYLFNLTTGAAQAYSGLSEESAVAAAGNGQIVFGTQEVTAGVGLDFQRARRNPTSGQYGIQAVLDITQTVNDAVGSYRAIVGDAIARPAAGTTMSVSPHTVRGVTGIGRNVTAGTVSWATGVMGQVINSGGGAMTVGACFVASGITNTQPNGTVATQYGLYIAAQNATGVTTAYGIYQISASDRNYFAGKVSIGITQQQALLHLGAGTAAANTAPIKLTAGVNLASPENGALEFDGAALYITIAGVRKTINVT